MPKPKELALADAYKMAHCIHELKVDGTSMEWTGTELISDRGIVRNDRFPHIVQELSALDFTGRCEVAVPGGHVHDVTASTGWPKARAYIYDVNEYRGKDYRGADPSTVRRAIDEILRPRFDTLRSPMFFDSFKKGWDFVCKTREAGRYAEGIVLKDTISGKQWKVKYFIEEKLEITGHEGGSVKGSFIVDRKGTPNKVSALSVGHIADWQKILKAGNTPYAEIEYLFLTAAGKMFQPRLRRIGTWAELQSAA